MSEAKGGGRRLNRPRLVMVVAAVVLVVLGTGGYLAIKQISVDNDPHRYRAMFSVDVGDGQKVFYVDGATRDDAQRVGEALIDIGYYEGDPGREVMIAGPEGAREIAFPVKDDGWDSESHSAILRGLVDNIALAIGGDQVTLLIVDQEGNEKKRLQFQFNTQPSVDMGNGQEVFYVRGATRDDAQRVGEALIASGYFEGTKGRDVIIAGPAGAREIGFLFADQAWNSELVVLHLRSVVEDIAPALGGDGVTMRLLGVDGHEKKRLEFQFNSLPSVDAGGGKFFYVRGATREDAQRLDAALTEAGAPLGPLVVIAGPVGAREISIPVKDGQWDNEFFVLGMRVLAERIAPAIGGKPVTLRLLDGVVDEKKRLHLAIDMLQPFVDLGGGQIVGYMRGATREDAQRVGDALISAGFFDGADKASVLLAGPSGDREISFNIEVGWDDQLFLLELGGLVEDIAPAIGGGPVTVRVVDSDGNERKRLHIN